MRQKINKIFFCFYIFFLLLFYQNSYAQQHLQNIAQEAQKAYNEAQYFYAIELYDSIIQQGFTSASLYYNLGNAYFKSNQMPYAILYYEKAKILSPSDEHINFNLMLANTLITDKIDVLPQLFYERWWQAIYSMFSMDLWAKISIASIFLLFISMAFYLITNTLLIKKLSFWLCLVFVFITLFSLIFAQKQYNHTYKQQTAIVFSPRITAKSSPDENSIDLFVIHEGTKVSIKDNLGDWCEIKLANGNVGWIKRNLLKTI